MKRCLYLAWSSVFLCVCLQLASPAALRAQAHSGPNALVVKMVVDDGIDSATATVGQEVQIHVSEAVRKENNEVIAAGAQVMAHVTRVKRPSHGDRSGQIKLNLVSVQNVTGDWIPLHGGAVHKGHRLIALFAGPCSVPFPLTMLMVGEDVKIPKGQALTAYVRTADLH